MANNLVTVGDFVFVPEAEAARLHLQEEGIPAFLSNAELVNMDWFLGNATGYVKILVPADQAIAARDILKTLQSQKQARRQNRFTAGDTSVCLSCGEPLPADQSTCAACGWSYAAETGETEADELGEPARHKLSQAEAASWDQTALAEKNETEANGKDKRQPVPSDGQHGEYGQHERDNPAETEEDAQEMAETSAANTRLLIALVVGGAILLWLLPQLRVAVRSWL